MMGHFLNQYKQESIETKGEKLFAEEF